MQSKSKSIEAPRRTGSGEPRLAQRDAWRELLGARPAVDRVLAGARSIAELDENIVMMSLPIPLTFWTEVDERGLPAPRVPLP